MIIVFGSLNMDMVMTVKSLPKAGETIICSQMCYYSGGKGANQAAAAAKAGGLVSIYGAVGKDDFGKNLLCSLGQAGVDTKGVKFFDAPTGCAMIYVDQDGENIVAVARGANEEARFDQIPPYIWEKQPWVLLQMEVSIEQNFAVIKESKKRGGKTILNLAPAQEIPLSLLSMVNILVVNEGEARILASSLGLNDPIETQAQQLGCKLARLCNIQIIITLGSHGSIACTPDGKGWSISAMTVKVIDTTAAGDAFIGSLAAALDQQEDLPYALRCATVASALSCSRRGAQASFANRSLIKSYLSQAPEPIEF